MQKYAICGVCCFLAGILCVAVGLGIGIALLAMCAVGLAFEYGWLDQEKQRQGQDPEQSERQIWSEDHQRRIKQRIRDGLDKCTPPLPKEEYAEACRRIYRAIKQQRKRVQVVAHGKPINVDIE